MRRFFVHGLILAISAVSFQLSGCSTPPLSSQLPHFRQAPTEMVDLSEGYQLLAANDATSLAEENLIRMHRQMRNEILATLNLTATQKEEIKAIKAKYRPQFKNLGIKAEWQKIKSILLAPTVNQTALRTESDTMQGIRRAMVPILVAEAGDVRNVLTPDQRNKAIAFIQNMKTARMQRAHERLMIKMTSNLNLTPAQTQQLTDIRNKIKTLVAQDTQTLKQAKIQFLQTGDQTALTNTLDSMIGQGPRDEGLAWVSSLNQNQRQLLVNKIDEVHAKWRAAKKMNKGW